MEDPGAEGSGISPFGPLNPFTRRLTRTMFLASNSDYEHFSDASEGHAQLQSSLESGNTSTIPRTRVERVDSSAQHGEVPGTKAYEQREQDAVADEIAVIPEDAHNDISPTGSQNRSLTPGDLPIPQTTVEKVDPASPSYGEVPGTEAHVKRLADAVPDRVTIASDAQPTRASRFPDTTSEETKISDRPVPETRISRVDAYPTTGETSSQTRAHRAAASDAQPDSVETIPDTSLSELPSPIYPDQQNSISQDVTDEQVEEEDQVVDDFDGFVEEQDPMGDDEFGDFDDGFQEPNTVVDEGTPNKANTNSQQFNASSSVVSR